MTIVSYSVTNYNYQISNIQPSSLCLARWLEFLLFFCSFNVRFIGVAKLVLIQTRYHPAFIDDDDILFQTKSLQVMWTALPPCRPPPPSRGPTPRRPTPPPAPPSSWTTRRQRVSRLDTFICLSTNSGLEHSESQLCFFPWKYVNIVDTTYSHHTTVFCISNGDILMILLISFFREYYFLSARHDVNYWQGRFIFAKSQND